MSGLKHLIAEIHRRSLWQVLLIYVGGAWICYEIIDTITDRLALPEWLPALAIILFLIGLPVVLATAFVHEVAPPTVTPTEPSPLTEADAARIESEAAAVHLQTRRRHRFLTWRNAAATFVIVVAAWGVVATGWLLLGERAPEAVDPRKSIAVLPFENIGDVEENQAFTDGIHDDILTHLYKIGDLKAISRTSVMEYRDVQRNLKLIAEELGVATILEGGIQRSGNRVRINVQLIDAETDEHIWAEAYEEELTADNVFAIQVSIAERIASELRVLFLPEEQERIAARPTANLEAYEYYLRGRVALDFDTATGMLQRAVELDPNFAAAWADLARRRIYRSFFRMDTDLRDKGIEALNRAIDLAPDAFETYVARAAYHRQVTQDMDQALEQLRFAERLRPNDADLLATKAYDLQFAGQWDEALTTLEKAAELDPLNSGVAISLASANQRRGDFAEAERYFDRAIALDPSNPVAYDRKFRFLVRSLGDTTRAREFADQHPERSKPWQAALNYVRRDYGKALEFYLSEPMSQVHVNTPNWYIVKKIYQVKRVSTMRLRHRRRRPS
jgi:TolB-like protein/Tfp pilus assembly protein PilF